MQAIKAQVIAAIRKYQSDFHEDLVYWDGESIPQYGDLLCELSLVSSQEESYREVEAGTGTSFEVSPSSLVLAAVQLKFESLNNTVNPFALDLAERTRQALQSTSRRLDANAEGLAILTPIPALICRRKLIDGRSVMFCVLETQWRFEYSIPASAEDEPETLETIRTVVGVGEGELTGINWVAQKPELEPEGDN